jgi:hypothetical protein
LLHALGNLTFAVWFGSWFADMVAEDIVVEEIKSTTVESIVQQSWIVKVVEGYVN